MYYTRRVNEQPCLPQEVNKRIVHDLMHLVVSTAANAIAVSVRSVQVKQCVLIRIRSNQYKYTIVSL